MPSSDPTRLVIFGKGGVGKSTFAANLSMHLALEGQKVLHVGCDPKADSTFLLLAESAQPRTVVSVLSNDGSSGRPEDIINRGRHGIDCIEIGGPEPGIGCGGRGIARALETMASWRVIEDGNYDVVLFDVLGDVVCGGFAAPLRQGFGDRVLIVASQDEMSFYAANNIAKAVVRYSVNGVVLAGLVVNQRGPLEVRLDGREFAQKIGTQVVGTLPVSRGIEVARENRLTLVESAATDPYTAVVKAVAAYVQGVDKSTLGLPTPMDGTQFHHFVTGDRFRTASLPARKEVAKQADPPRDEVPVTRRSTAGQDVVGGAGSRAVFSRLLGFLEAPLASRGARVKSVARKADGDIWLVVEVAGIGARRLMIRPPGKGAFVQNSRLGVAYSGGIMTPQFQQFLTWAAKRLARHTFAQLEQVVVEDPGAAIQANSGTSAALPVFAWNVRGGPAILARLRGLLAELEWVDSKTDGSVELGLSSDPGPTIVVLSPPETGAGWVDARRFGVGYRGEMPPHEGEKLVVRVADVLGSWSLEELHETIRHDPESVELGRPGSLAPVETPMAPPAWARFFAAEEFARNIFHLFRVNVPHVTVEHCDAECRFATPMISNNEFNFLNYPWLTPGPHPADPYTKSSEPGRYYTSRLQELDVISGSTGRLSEILEQVVDNLGDEALIMLNNTCVPVVAGDDVDSLVKALRPRCRVPIMSMGSHIEDNPFVSLFEAMREDRGFQSPEKVACSFNLVGFPAGKGVPELESLLALAGITVNCRSFPEVDLAVFDTYLAAEHQVLYPLAHFQELYDKLFGHLPITTVQAGAPYGMAGTREWLMGVAAALGKVPEMAENIAREEDALAPLWKRQQAQASGFTLGFVLVGDDATVLTTPGLSHGIPVLSVLQEAGFGLAFLAHAEARLPDALAAVAKRFASRVELDELLDSSPAQAFYSDFTFDRRLTAAGKAAFSLQHFEMGLAGALRTAASLCGLCRLPFYARYGHYLRDEGRP